MQATRADCSIIVIQSGTYECIGIRDRATQTLYISDLIEPHACEEPSYGKLHVGIYIAAVKDAIDRAKQNAARSADDPNGSGLSDDIDHKDEGGSKGPRDGGRKRGKKGGKKGNKPTEGSSTMFIAVDILAKVCFIQCFIQCISLAVHDRELWKWKAAVGPSWCTSNMAYTIHPLPPRLFVAVQMDKPLFPSLHGKPFEIINSKNVSPSFSNP